MFGLVFQKDFDAVMKRLQSLESLLSGVKRIVAPDGTEGIYIPYRVGIQSEWWLHQPLGQGVSLCVATAQDPIAAYIQHDGDQVPDPDKKIKGRRTALVVHNTDYNELGINSGIDIIATNAPHGNVAIDAKAQYSPNAPEKVTIIKQSEWVS